MRRKRAVEVAHEVAKDLKEGDVVSWFDSADDGSRVTSTAPVEWTDGKRVQVTSPVDGAAVLLPVESVVKGGAPPVRSGAARVAARAASAVGRGARRLYGGARDGLTALVRRGRGKKK